MVSQDLELCGFPTDPALVDDVIEQVGLTLIRESAREPSDVIDVRTVETQNPMDRVSRLARRVVDDMSRPDHTGHRRGRRYSIPVDRPDSGEGRDSDVEHSAPEHSARFEASMSDAIRSLIGRSVAPPRLTAAALAYVVLLADPSLQPSDVVAPPEDTNADEARAWCALWMTGAVDLFVDPCPPAVEARRGRTIGDLVRLIDEMILRCRLETDLDGR